MLAEKLWNDANEYSGAWNFGPSGDAVTVGALTQNIIELWGDGAQWTIGEGVHLHEAHYLKLDCTKARQKLGWQPQLTLAEALSWVIEWYKFYAEKRNIGHITLDQIKRFEHVTKENYEKASMSVL